MGFDLRTKTLGKPSFSFRSSVRDKPLYAHAALADDIVMLGFEDGVVELVDMRTAGDISYTTFEDPGLHVVGDIVASPSLTKVATLGRFGASLWEHATETLCFRGTLGVDGVGKVGATFISDDVLALSDSSGTLSIYDVAWGASFS